MAEKVSVNGDGIQQIFFKSDAGVIDFNYTDRKLTSLRLTIHDGGIVVKTREGNNPTPREDMDMVRSLAGVLEITPGYNQLSITTEKPLFVPCFTVYCDGGQNEWHVDENSVMPDMLVLMRLFGIWSTPEFRFETEKFAKDFAQLLCDLTNHNWTVKKGITTPEVIRSSYNISEAIDAQRRIEKLKKGDLPF